MNSLPNYGDARQLAFCAFCGGKTGTRDHCPSKILLDEPLPPDLPIVPACIECNSGFSIHEEYVACLISCVVAGSTEPNMMVRDKVRRILTNKPALRSRIEKSKVISDDGVMFSPEFERIREVMLKLAKGHALYEFNEPCTQEPDHFLIIPLTSMGLNERYSFENPDAANVWPEVECRAMQRLILGTGMSHNGWIIVQEERYRYNASIVAGLDIRIVINDYLACHVCWD